MANCSARRAQRVASLNSSWIISAVVRPVSSSPGLSKSVLLRCHSSLTSFCSCSKERRVMREKVHSRCPLSRGSSPDNARASADFPLPLLPTKAQLSPARTLRCSIFNVLVSLRRNVPCEICNNDIVYPTFCSDVLQGYVFASAMSMPLAQRGKNDAIGVKICYRLRPFRQIARLF